MKRPPVLGYLVTSTLRYVVELDYDVAPGVPA